MQSLKLLKLPKRVTFEFTNLCNRQCAGCPRHLMDYPLGNMTPSLLSSIVKQLPSRTVAVAFFRGESLLHPQFNEMLRILGKFKTVQLASNLDYVTPSKQHAIMDVCTFFSYSLHEPLKPQTSRHVGFLSDLKQAGVETQVSILDTLIEDNKEEFTRDWIKIVDRVRVYRTHSTHGFGNMNHLIVNTTCCKPFEEMVVLWDGRVALCNHDWNLSFPLGDLNEKNVKQVWMGAYYDGVRDLHNLGLRRAVPTCEFCSFESNHVYGELIKVKNIGG